MFTLAELERIATEVIGLQVRVMPQQSAADIPGWDSLNNTIIALDISSAHSIDVTGEDLGKCATFAELIEVVNSKIADGVS